MDNQRPALVTPMHDGDGMMLRHLGRVTADLKRMFGRAILGITPRTQHLHPAAVAALAEDRFFRVVALPDAPVGVQFRALYAEAAQTCAARQALHLCFVDRVAFALQTEHREQFMADISGVRDADLPLIFDRSPAAWATHPSNYRELEGMVRWAGELALGRSLDFAWCHLVLCAGQLAAILPSVRRPDMSMVAELALALQDALRSREVDWLAWEDPFLEGRAPAVLKRERETSPAETRKRLDYVVPMLELIREAAHKVD